jgi:hypothetical protein
LSTFDSKWKCDAHDHDHDHDPSRSSRDMQHTEKPHHDLDHVSIAALGLVYSALMSCNSNAGLPHEGWSARCLYGDGEGCKRAFHVSKWQSPKHDAKYTLSTNISSHYPANSRSWCTVETPLQK